MTDQGASTTDHRTMQSLLLTMALSLGTLIALSVGGATVASAQKACPQTGDGTCCSTPPAGYHGCTLTSQECYDGINGSCNSECSWTSCFPN